MSSTLIGATMRRGISLIYSILDPEGTWTEAAHACLFMNKLGEMRGGIFVFTKLSLMMLTAGTFKAYHDSTKMEFMW